MIVLFMTMISITFTLGVPSISAQSAPELAVTTVSVEPPTPVEGTEVTLFSVVMNRGGQTAWYFKVAALVDGTPIHSENVVYLSPFASKAFSAQWIATAGEHQICWLADSDDDVLEVDEINNEMCVSLEVPPLTYDVTVFIAGLPGIYSTKILVDGSSAGVVLGGGSRPFSFDQGTPHTISVDQYVSGASEERFHALTNSWAFESDDSYTFQYERQFYLNVKTNPIGIALIPGEGWYLEGSQLTLAAPAVHGYVFSDWSSDGTILQTSTLAITMNSPHRVVADYAVSAPPSPPRVVDDRLIVVGGVILVPVIVWWAVKKTRED